MMVFVYKFFILLSILGYTVYGSEVDMNFTPDSSASVKLYQQEKHIDKTDSLNQLYGLNKELPPGFEIQALLALKHYPDLKNVKIDFIYKKTMIPLSSRPKVFSTLRKKENRKYKVIISSESLKAMENILLKNLPFNSQIGIIGHELAHTMYYQDKNFLQVIGIGFMYIFPRYRAKFEKDTDKRTINHGLGYQLLEYAEFVRNQSDSSYTNFDMDKFYLNPDEIKKYMESLSVY